MEQISLMKPKGVDKNDTGLLEYLEDIIGTDKFVEPIEENAKKCRRTRLLAVAPVMHCGSCTLRTSNSSVELRAQLFGAVVEVIPPLDLVF